MNSILGAFFCILMGLTLIRQLFYIEVPYFIDKLSEGRGKTWFSVSHMFSRVCLVGLCHPTGTLKRHPSLFEFAILPSFKKEK